MNRLVVIGLCIAVGLVACSTTGPTLPAAAAGVPTVATTDDESARGSPPARAALSTAVLPSLTRSGALKIAAPLRLRPTTGSAALKNLSAGDAVQILGELDNADGHWLSVATADVQGWLKAGDVAE